MKKLNLLQFILIHQQKINNRFKVEHAFQEILYRIDAWINKGSGWIIESIES